MRIFRSAMESIGGYSRDRSAGHSSHNEDSFTIDKKYQTSDFLYEKDLPSKSPQPKYTPKKISLSKNFFAILSSLETKILIEKNHSLELIDTLVNMYK